MVQLRRRSWLSSVQNVANENINVKPGEILLSEDCVSFQARNQVLYMLKLMSKISGLE